MNCATHSPKNALANLLLKSNLPRSRQVFLFMITLELLKKLFPLTPAAKRNRFIDTLNKFLPEYEINTSARVCAFLACVGVESDYLKAVCEYASGAEYEGNHTLGNRVRGDGRKFKGRGLIQVTGRKNYENLNRSLGAKYGIDFIQTPERLEEIDLAVESACVFWQENDLNDYADAGEFKKLNGVVNRGDENKLPIQWAKRNELYSLCKRCVPQKIFIDQSADVSTLPAPLINENLSQTDDNSSASRPSNSLNGVAGDTTNDRQSICKERPSTFVRWLTGMKVAVGAGIASISTYFTGSETAHLFAGKAAENLDADIISKLLIILGFGALGLIFGGALMWIASVFYDRSANRSNALNIEKLQIASNKNLITTELAGG